MQTRSRIHVDAPSSRTLPADFSAMKDRIIREARIAQSTAIRAACARVITAIAAIATRRRTATAAMTRPRT